MKSLLLFIVLAPCLIIAQTNKFPSSGSVGIGTLSPAAKLEVVGVVKAKSLLLSDNNTIYKEGYGFGVNSDRGYIIKQSWESGLGDYFEINNLDAIGGGERVDYIFRISGRDGFQFIPREKEAMRITREGNVGIGTITPDAKLAVNGKIHTQEVKVDVDGWSDFVFENDYNLPTLDEVERHIQEKGHLQDIPSAKEVEQNGIHLGEMNAKLLQKIEELTLYVIELKKQNDLQQKEINKLKRLNEK
ncbi:hypothetical protein [Joostella sp. CR20]|uniref:hypothetical protein n=1 Tax=Joostella sp. CR20 TaxID=2804312 RepID=UPI00313E2164